MQVSKIAVPLPRSITCWNCFQQEYFISPANVEEFARTMRLFSKDISEYFLQDGNVPTSIARGVVGINEFIEVLSPYFYNPNNK